METSNTDYFYANLPVLNSFFEISNPDNYHPVPENWYVGVTDIEDSTGAIHNNQYKQVNILGASPIIGIMNETNRADLPYSFGGDGCAISFPPKFKDPVRRVFKACRIIGKKEYDLRLRTAIIPVQDLLDKGYRIDIARFRVSDNYNQAVFKGGGLSCAEEILRAKESPPIKKEIPVPPVDFSGLECRWQEVKPEGKSILSVLIQCNPAHDKPEAVYDNILNKLRKIFRLDEKSNPIRPANLDMHLSIPALMHETKFRTFNQGWATKIKYVLKIQLQILLGKIFMKLGYKSKDTNWALYKSDLSSNSDHRKFDDMFRMVISADKKQIKAFERFLDEQYRKSTLAYGLHTSDAAVITCMVFSYHHNHIHFVDGSNGGYVKAAKSLKTRLQKLKAE